jgi:hypothetical protein
MPCPARRHAAAVIEAAGDDPRSHDNLPTNGATIVAVGEQDWAGRTAAVAVVPDHVTGCRVGTRRADLPYFDYQRSSLT